MEVDELTIMVENLKAAQRVLMKDFAYSLVRDYNYGYNPDLSVMKFKRLVETQNLINEYERIIADQKGIGYVNKFGKIVYSLKDLEYWNNLFDMVSPKKEEEPVKTL